MPALASDPVLESLLRRSTAGRPTAVVFVISAGVPHPWPPGSWMAVEETGDACGTVAEGVLAEIVIRQAVAVLKQDEPCLLRSGGVGFYLTPVPRRDLLERLRNARLAGLPVALVIDLGTGLMTLVFNETIHGGFAPEPAVLGEIRRFMAAGTGGILDAGEDGRLFVHCPSG
ncbi:MAG: XdhC family protein [Rhodospirillaceae bacterium]